MTKGWIRVHRQIWQNKYWHCEPFSKGQAWIDLLLLANHDDGMFVVRGNQVRVPRGYVGCSEETLASRWRWSRGKVRRFLKALKTDRQIVQHTSPILSLVQLANYDQYQTNGT